MTTIAVEAHEVKSVGVTVDLIVWQRFNHPMDGLVERIMEMPENAHLEHQAAELAVGTIVHIPIEDTRPYASDPTITLWD